MKKLSCDRTPGERRQVLGEPHPRAGADLLVMGAYAQRRFLEMIIGGATRDFLAKADVPVLMRH